MFDLDQVDKGILEVKYKLPYADSDHPEIIAGLMAKGEAFEHSHSLTDQLGGQLDAGFHIIAMYEDHHSNFAVSEYTPTFIATRAYKPHPE
jgi:hypothetical protein